LNKKYAKNNNLFPTSRQHPENQILSPKLSANSLTDNEINSIISTRTRGAAQNVSGQFSMTLHFGPDNLFKPRDTHSEGPPQPIQLRKQKLEYPLHADPAIMNGILS